jgi:hypothetical protein
MDYLGDEMNIGDKVKCISEEWLSHRKGRIIGKLTDELTDELTDGFWLVQFEGNIQEQPFIFQQHQLEKTEDV